MNKLIALLAGVVFGLGLAWALPLRKIFLGIGQPDPDAPQNRQD